MVAKEFLGFYQTIAAANRFTLEDFGDRLNLITAILFLVSCLLITANQYLLSPIACYIPVRPTGEKFAEYLADYCWVHGTIPFRPDEKLPSTSEDWSRYDQTRRITYYQWVPFILGLQCIMFYIPHIFWQSLCSKQASGDLFNLVKVASSGATEDRTKRMKCADRIAEFVEDMLGEHRPCRKSNLSKLAATAYNSCGILVPSKRLGTRLVFSYLVVKLVTVVNVLLQILLIQRFLGFHPGSSASRESMNLDVGQNLNDVSTHAGDTGELYGYGFGFTVLRQLLSGKEWPETLLFPRVAHCYVGDIYLVGVKNMYTAQCALPVNMVNEKLYIFFWFWLMFMLAVAIYSTMMWFIRTLIANHRKDFIKRYLRMKDVTSPLGDTLTRDNLKEFIDGYLRQDGVFLLRMLALNAGDVMAGDVTAHLYEHYIDKHGTLDEKPPFNELKKNEA